MRAYGGVGSPITPTIIFPLFTLFLSHKLLLKFSPLYMTNVSCFPSESVNSLFFHSRIPTLTGYEPRRYNRSHWIGPLFDSM